MILSLLLSAAAPAAVPVPHGGCQAADGRRIIVQGGIAPNSAKAIGPKPDDPRGLLAIGPKQDDPVRSSRVGGDTPSNRIGPKQDDPVDPHPNGVANPGAQSAACQAAPHS